MLTIRSGGGRAAVVAAALAMGSGAWAAAPAQRAAAVTAAQDRVSALQARLAAVQPQNPKADALARAARVQLSLAQKSLDRHDTRAAQTLADVAERLTTLAENKKAAR